MSDKESPQPNNGTSVALSKLLSQLNVPTLMAIFLMNGWGIQTTNSTSSQREEQIQIALRQIRELHDAIDDFEKRQKDEMQIEQQILTALKRNDK